MSDPLPYTGAPRWVKVSGIVVSVVALLFFVVIHLGGGHNMHSAGGLGGHPADQNGHR